jgi:hypothetical protein
LRPSSRASGLPWLLSLPGATACGRLDSIPHLPPETAETWLAGQPYARVEIASWQIVVVQPSTSLIVYLLGLLTIGVGVYFLCLRGGQRSRRWWGIALLLWGVGALLAGTSYQAFSHAIKCEGRPACVWTSWWEVIYLVLTVASVNALLRAVALACSVGRRQEALSLLALGNTAAYLGVALIGALVPVKLLISFELMLLFTAPTVAICFVVNAARYRAQRGSLDRALLGAWTWLGLTLGAYAFYRSLGVGQRLWARGLWFSENDVLHVGLILWMLYLARVVAKRLVDANAPPQEPAPGSPA